MNDMNVVKAQEVLTPAPKAVSSSEPKSNGSFQSVGKSEDRLQPEVNAKPQVQAEASPNLEALDNSDDVLNELNAQLKVLQSYLKFEKDEDTDRMVFFIKDSETDEIIRQVPAKELLQISKNISDYLEQINSTKDNSSIPVGLITNEIA